MWVSRERTKVATRDRFAGLDGALDARVPSNDDPACARDVCATAGSELPNMQPGSMPRRPDGTGSSSRSRVARVAAVGLWAVACASPEVQLVPAPEWPAPAARGAFVGVFDADGALTVYPHTPDGATPLAWVPLVEPLRVAAGVVDAVDATLSPGGATWLPAREGSDGFTVALEVWRWEGQWVSSKLSARFASSTPGCPSFRVERVGGELETSTTASRRLTVLTGGAVAVTPEDWRAPPDPSHQVWTAAGLGSSVKGSAPLWSCAARGQRLFIDHSGPARLFDDARPWPPTDDPGPTILRPPAGVTLLGPCVALSEGWGAVTVDGRGFVRLAEGASVRGANPPPDGLTTATALAVTRDDTPIAYFPDGEGGRFAAYPADDRTLAAVELLRARGLVELDQELIAWGRDGDLARLVVEPRAALRWVERPTRLTGVLLSRLFAYRGGLLALTTTGHLPFETAGGAICAAGRLPRTLGTAVVEGVVVGDDVRIVVSEVVGDTRRFEYYSLIRE